MKVINRVFILSILICTLFISCNNSADNKLIGVKIYELSEPIPELINQWCEIGINTAFVSEGIARNKSFMDQAKSHQIDVFIIYPIYFNPPALKKDSSLYAITDKGTPAKESWVEFVCPTRPAYQSMMTDHAKKLIQETEPTGISMDFIRYFAYWEMIDPNFHPDSIPEACFCDHCVKLFCSENNIVLPNELSCTKDKSQWIITNYREDWANWKTEQITGFVSTFTSELKEVDLDIKFNLHAVPWRPNDYNGAIKNIVGQDFKSLSKYVDYISPMCYTFMLYRPPEWINSIVQDLSKQGIENVIPSIQVKECYRDNRFTVDEFKACLDEVLKEPSKGVIFWSWDYIQQEPDKKELIKKIIK